MGRADRLVVGGGGTLLSRDFVLLLLAIFGALANYAPLLSVVPLWAADGGAGGTGVGATIGVMMAATVLAQMAMGWLFRLLTLRRMVAVGALVMGVATPAYALSSALVPVLVISAVRGVGFALVVVAGAALVVELVADRQLGTGTGVFGLAAGLPNVVALPVAVWVAQQVGFVPVFLGTAALALLAVPLMLAMSREHEQPTTPPPRPLGGRRADAVAMARPAAVFLATAVALGGATTFLPLAVPEPTTASVALFALSVCMIVGRVGAGALGDRVAAGRLLLPAAVTSALGTGGIAWATSTDLGALVVLAAAVFGLGFGAAQNDSLVVILRRAGPGRHGTASAIWNIAFDAGTGLGAVVLGVVVARAGYSWAYATAAIAIVLVAPLALRSRSRSGSGSARPAGG